MTAPIHNLRHNCVSSGASSSISDIVVVQRSQGEVAAESNTEREVVTVVIGSLQGENQCSLSDDRGRVGCFAHSRGRCRLLEISTRGRGPKSKREQDAVVAAARASELLPASIHFYARGTGPHTRIDAI